MQGRTGWRRRHEGGGDGGEERRGVAERRGRQGRRGRGEGSIDRGRTCQIAKRTTREQQTYLVDPGKVKVEQERGM